MVVCWRGRVDRDGYVDGVLGGDEIGGDGVSGYDRGCPAFTSSVVSKDSEFSC